MRLAALLERSQIVVRQAATLFVDAIPPALCVNVVPPSTLRSCDGSRNAAVPILLDAGSQPTGKDVNTRHAVIVNTVGCVNGINASLSTTPRGQPHVQRQVRGQPHLQWPLVVDGGQDCRGSL